MRFQLSPRLKGGLVLGLLASVLARPLVDFGAGNQDTGLAPRVVPIESPPKGGAGKGSSTGTGSSGDAGTGSSATHLGVGDSQPAKGDDSTPRLGTGDDSGADSAAAAGKTGFDQIKGNLPKGWTIQRDPPKDKLSVGPTAVLDSKFNLGDENWVQWIIADGITERMSFATNPKLKVIIRYDAKLQDEAGNRLVSMKGRDIVMTAWKQDAAEAKVPVSDLETIVAQDIQGDHRKVIDDTFSQEKTNKKDFGLYNANGVGQGGFTKLTTESVQGKGIKKLVDENQQDLGGKQITSIEAYTKSSLFGPWKQKSPVYALYATLSP